QAQDDNPPPRPGEDSPAQTGDDKGQGDSDPPAGEQPAEPRPPEDEDKQGADTGASEGKSGDGTEEAEAQQAAVMPEASDREQQQALEQWLRRVPDDPAGLLRNKFRYQYQRRTEERIEQKL